jgi:hypothetical protein
MSPTPFHFALKRQQRPFDDLAERRPVHDLTRLVPGLLGCDDLGKPVVSALRDAGIEENRSARFDRPAAAAAEASGLGIRSPQRRGARSQVELPAPGWFSA